MRAAMVMIWGALMVGCQGADLPRKTQEAPQERTASPYSAGPDASARGQRIEGASTGIEFEAPPRIPGVMSALDQVSRPGGTADQANVTAYRNNMGSLDNAMRNDLTRAGQADTGEYDALSDSIAADLGGGAGGLAKEFDRKELPMHAARVKRLIAVYRERMASAKQ